MTGLSQVTKQQAIDFVMDSIVGAQVDSVNVYMEASVQTGSYYILCKYDSIPAPYSSYWFFFIDQKPLLGWDHESRYVFIDTGTGDYSIVIKQIPPFRYKMTLEPVSVPFDLSISPPNSAIPKSNLPYPAENHNL
jgi:hypothetical protein